MTWDKNVMRCRWHQHDIKILPRGRKTVGYPSNKLVYLDGTRNCNYFQIPSDYIKKNQHRNPIINRLHAPAQQLYQIWRGSMRWYWLYNGKESGLKLLPVCILTISKSHRIPENVHREPCMVKTVYFSTEAKSCAKYEQDPLDIMGCRMVTKRNERKDGCRVRQ